MKISVALCTYNGEKFLREQLNSILNQTCNVNEIIICDDNSSDETITIIQSFQDQFPDIICLHQNIPGLGTIKNFEKAISLTTGDLIFLSDQDDIWSSEKVEKMSQNFNENQRCLLLFSNGSLIDENGDEIKSTLWDKWGFDENLKSIWSDNKMAFKFLVEGVNKITGATVCFHKSLKKTISPIDLPLNYWHDGWLGTNAAALNGLFFIDETLIKYRIHNNQQVGIYEKVPEIITLEANKKFITRDKYFYKLKKMYPYLNQYFPYQKKNFLQRVLSKLFFL